jgi:TRAP-type transport system periplasmic protein
MNICVSLLWLFVLLGAFASFAQAQPASSASRELKLSTALGPAYAQGKAGEVWARLIRERSSGRIAVVHFPGATAIDRDPAKEYTALRNGVIDMAVASTLAWSSQMPQLGVIALPWLVADEAAIDALLRSEVMARLEARLDTAGVVAVYWSSNGFVEIAGEKALRNPGDFAGLKVRAPAAPIIAGTLEALGAAAVIEATGSAASALPEHNAQEISVAAFRASHRALSSFPYLQLWGAHADVLLFTVSRALWYAWSPTDRELVKLAATDAAKEARILARRSTSESALADLVRQGAHITRLTPAGKLAFRSAAQPVYDKWGAIIGEDLVREAQLAGKDALPVSK